jgi:superfamily II DNA/RNA helicase
MRTGVLLHACAEEHHLTSTTPTLSFDALGISKPVIDALHKNGITAPFAIQTAVLPDALDGIDILARSRTGSGKTLAFALPIVELLRHDDPKPSALVLVPTRELAVQVAEEFSPLAHARGLKVALAYGGVSIQKQATQAARAQILVATPGRLYDLMERGLVHLDGVMILVLDEADHMLDLGFQPQVDRIVSRIPEQRQTMLFSATLDGAVGKLANKYTHEPVLHELDEESHANNDVTHRFIGVQHSDKAARLQELLLEDGSQTLVFVRTKHGAARLAQRLERDDIDAVAMHGDMNQRQRERALEKFSSGRASALIATDVAARGIDVDHIMRVINFDAPNDDKAFVHRVGRTGRAGRTGTSITFVTADQHREVHAMAKRLELTDAFVADLGEPAGRGSAHAPAPKRRRHSQQRRGGGRSYR